MSVCAAQRVYGLVITALCWTTRGGNLCMHTEREGSITFPTSHNALCKCVYAEHVTKITPNLLL